MQNQQQYYVKKIKELNEIINHIEENQKNKIPGSLRVSSSKNQVRYYRHLVGQNENKPYIYLSSSESEIAKQLAQQDYEAKLLPIAKKLLKNAIAHYQEYNEYEARNLFANLVDSRKKLISPLITDDTTYVSEWQKTHSCPSLLTDGATKFYTNNNELVRSKSEKIIADYYYKSKIPYVYEFPLELWDGSRAITIHPDFTLLNVRTREIIYHEHFGLIDDPEYSNTFLSKLELYMKNDIFPWENLIITMESSLHPFNIKSLEKISNNYFQ